MPRVKKIVADERIQKLTQRIWNDWYDKYGSSSGHPSSPPTVLLTRRSRNLYGYAHYASNTITLYCFTEEGVWEKGEWFETLLHEIAHHIAPRRANHGREFLSVISELEHEWYPNFHGRWGMAGCIGANSTRGIGWRIFPCYKELI